MKRLCKGLASSRKGARQGFATVLTEVLHQFDCIETDQVLDLLEKSLQVTGNAKSQVDTYINIGKSNHTFYFLSRYKLTFISQLCTCAEIEELQM